MATQEDVSRLVWGALMPGVSGPSVEPWQRAAFAAGVESVCLFAGAVGSPARVAATVRALRRVAPDVLVAVVDVSRLEADALADALYAGDAARFARVIADLRDSGEAVPAILWQVSSAVQLLLRLKLALSRGESLPGLMRTLWGRDKQRGPQIERALRRLDLAQIETALAALATVDRQAKGLERIGDPWDTLQGVGRTLAAPPGAGSQA